MITGEDIDIEAGPNWDDDLGGSPIYAANDPNLKGLTEQQRATQFASSGWCSSTLPRICNHCLNPCCVASCPSGALYKRGEDGIVLVDQKKCRAWRVVRGGLPVQEDLLQLVHRQDRRSASSASRGWRRARRRRASIPASAGSATSGVLLYDADRLEEVAKLPDEELVEGQRSLILDPHDPEVIAAAQTNGIPTSR